LNWTPEVTFNELVTMMTKEDIENAKREKLLIDQNLLNPSWEYFLIP